MAGEIKNDIYRVPGGGVLHMVARECPVSKRYGDVCASYDPYLGTVKLCPFWYGTVLRSGVWHGGEARCPADLRLWMAAQGGPPETNYVTRCLRAESAGVRQGATEYWAD